MWGRRVRCRQVAEALPRILDGASRSDRRLVGHAEICLRCQAELARYRRIMRMLHQLRSYQPAAPAGARSQALLELHRGIERGVEPPARSNRCRIVAGAAAAGAVGILGVTAAVSAVGRRRSSAWRGPNLRSVVALLTLTDGPSGYGPPGIAAAAALRVAEGQ